MFESPTPTPRGSSAAGSSEDRRCEPRQHLERWVDLVLLDDAGEAVEHRRSPTFNLSRSGVGLLCERSAPIGTRVLVCVVGYRGGDASIRRCGLIRHADASAVPGYFSVGIEFDASGEDAERFNWALLHSQPPPTEE